MDICQNYIMLKLTIFLMEIISDLRNEYRISVNNMICIDNFLDYVEEDKRIVEILSFIRLIIKNMPAL